MSVRKKTVLLAVVAFVSLLFVVALTFVNSNAFNAELKRQITVKLNEATVGPSSIGRGRVDFFQLRFDIEQLTIPGKGSPLNPPLLSVQRIVARFSLRSFMSLPHLKSLELVQPKIYFEVNPDGSTNFPPLRSSSSR